MIDKNASSPFNGSGIDQLLRNLGLETLVLAGMATDMCVETTGATPPIEVTMSSLSKMPRPRFFLNTTEQGCLHWPASMLRCGVLIAS